MKYTQHLVLAVLLSPTAAVVLAAALSLSNPTTGAEHRDPVPQYGELENQP
jgi:hypothetical protein